MNGSIPSIVRFYPRNDMTAFPCDADNKETNKTAARWKGEGNKINEIITNDPRAGHVIKSLEIRNNGGRAYKVFTPEDYCVDLREDTLLDVMLNEGIVGGELKAELLWATVGSQFKLIRKGGEVHQQLELATKKSKMAPIAKSALEVGCVYEAQNGNRFIYLGQVDGFRCDITTERGYYDNFHYSSRYLYTLIPLKNYQLWCDLPYRKDLFDEQAFLESMSYYSLSRAKDKKVKMKVDQLPFVVNLAQLSSHVKQRIEKEMGDTDNAYFQQYWNFTEVK